MTIDQSRTHLRDGVIVTAVTMTPWGRLKLTPCHGRLGRAEPYGWCSSAEATGGA